MEFLVRTRLTRPASATDEEVAELMAAERDRGAELQDEGIIKRLWRVPGEWGAWVQGPVECLHGDIMRPTGLEVRWPAEVTSGLG